MDRAPSPRRRTSASCPSCGGKVRRSAGPGLHECAGCGRPWGSPTPPTAAPRRLLWIGALAGALLLGVGVTIGILLSRPSRRPEPAPEGGSAPPIAPKKDERTGVLSSPTKPDLGAIEEKWNHFKKTRDLPWVEAAKKWRELHEETSAALRGSAASPPLQEAMSAGFGLVARTWLREHEPPPAADACRTCWGHAIEKWCDACDGAGTRPNPGNPGCGVCPLAQGTCPSCRGEGRHEWMARVRCGTCAGVGLREADGVRPCDPCKATGISGARSIDRRAPCPFCMGRGKNECCVCLLRASSASSCPECGGAGKKAVGGHRASCECTWKSDAACSRCAGSGKVRAHGYDSPCPCVARPESNCGICGGSGSKATGETWVECGFCLIRRTRLARADQCRLCGGRRSLSCTPCAGSGKVPRVRDAGFHIQALGSVAGSLLVLNGGILATWAGCAVKAEDGEKTDAALDALLPGKLVRVEIAGPVEAGLLPAYVFCSDGSKETFLNAWLIQKGFARPRPSGTGRYDEILRRLAGGGTADRPKDDRSGAVLEEQRAQARRRLDEARKELARLAEERRATGGRLEAGLREATARRPFTLKLGEGFAIEGVRIVSFDGERVGLVWPQGETVGAIDQIPADILDPLLEQAVAGGTARDQFQVGKILLTCRRYDAAAKFFRKACSMDASLQPVVPDIEKIRLASRLFQGTFRVSGSTLEIEWKFRRENEGEDFAASRGKLRVVPASGLCLGGDALVLASVKEIPFRDRVKMTVLPGGASEAAHLVGIEFIRPDGSRVVILAGLDAAGHEYFVRRMENDRVQEIVPSARASTGEAMEMELSRGRFTFRIGRKAIWSGDEGGFVDVSVILGALTSGRSGAAAFREVRLSGSVSPVWIRKKTSEFRDVLAAELAREHRVPEEKNAGRSLALSFDPLLASCDAELRKQYGKTLELLDRFYRTRDARQIDAAYEALDALATRHPSFAPPRYFQGRLEEEFGDWRKAARLYDNALSRWPDFAEALLARARLGWLAGDFDATRLRLRHALELKPDSAEGQLLEAAFRLREGKTAEVADLASLAEILAPRDADVRSRARMMQNVARGPAWSRTSQVETAHYRVRSDLPESKCRLYAEHLDAMRPLYEEVTGVRPGAQERAEVLIFDTQEGYHRYVEFAAGDRQEQTLGMYFPLYGRLLLFEGTEQAETLAVLAHEGFHQYMHGTIPAAPVWFDEGMAEYVGASKVEKGKIAGRGLIQSGRLRNLKMAMAYGWQPRPFRKIMLESDGEFYGQDAPFKYAQAWSMVHFFRHAEGGKWKGAFDAYVHRLVAGDSASEAFEAAFGKLPMREIESAWRAYVEKLTP